MSVEWGAVGVGCCWGGVLLGWGAVGVRCCWGRVLLGWGAVGLGGAGGRLSGLDYRDGSNGREEGRRGLRRKNKASV